MSGKVRSIDEITVCVKVRLEKTRFFNFFFFGCVVSAKRDFFEIVCFTKFTLFFVTVTEYVYVTSHDCEYFGHLHIDDPIECKIATDSPSEAIVANEDALPFGCSYVKWGSTFNHYFNGVCNVFNSAHYFLINK